MVLLGVLQNISVADKYLVPTKLSVATRNTFGKINRAKAETKATVSFSRKTMTLYALLCT